MNRGKRMIIASSSSSESDESSSSSESSTSSSPSSTSSGSSASPPTVQHTEGKRPCMACTIPRTPSPSNEDIIEIDDLPELRTPSPPYKKPFEASGRINKKVRSAVIKIKRLIANKAKTTKRIAPYQKPNTEETQKQPPKQNNNKQFEQHIKEQHNTEQHEQHINTPQHNNPEQHEQHIDTPQHNNPAQHELHIDKSQYNTPAQQEQATRHNDTEQHQQQNYKPIICPPPPIQIPINFEVFELIKYKNIDWNQILKIKQKYKIHIDNNTTLRITKSKQGKFSTKLYRTTNSKYTSVSCLISWGGSMLNPSRI